MAKRMMRKLSQAVLISAATAISCGSLVNRPPEVEPARQVLIEKAPEADLQKNPVSHLLWRRSTEIKAHITITKTGMLAVGMPSPRFLADGYEESFVRVDAVLSAKITPEEKGVRIVSRHKSGDERECSVPIDMDGASPTIVGIERERGVDLYVLPTSQGQVLLENDKISAHLIEISFSTITRFDSKHPGADGEEIAGGRVSDMRIVSQDVRLPVQ